jgi:hypothetical protein
MAPRGGLFFPSSEEVPAPLHSLLLVLVLVLQELLMAWEQR